MMITFLHPLAALEDQPWFRQYLLPYVTFSFKYQTYENINIDAHPVPHWGSDFKQHISFYLSPLSNWCFEFEAVTAESRAQKGFDSAKILARYLLLSDLIGDPFSLAVGFCFTGLTHDALEDRSIFHHGREEYEFSAAFGKEISCGPTWNWHFWNTAALGIADRGSPWIWNKTAIAKQHEWGTWELYLRSLVSFGNHRMSLVNPFRGYGSLRQRSIDLGGQIRYQLERGELELAYQWRPWARNCPEYAHQIALSFIFPCKL